MDEKVKKELKDSLDEIFPWADHCIRELGKIPAISMTFTTVKMGLRPMRGVVQRFPWLTEEEREVEVKNLSRSANEANAIAAGVMMEVDGKLGLSVRMVDGDCFAKSAPLINEEGKLVGIGEVQSDDELKRIIPAWGDS